MSEIRQEFRWAVHFTDGDGNDDWQLVKNSGKRYFASELEAKDFAKQFEFKNKPHYWQPSIWKEEKFVYETEAWRVCSPPQKLNQKKTEA